MKELGARLKAARKAKGLSLQYVATHLGLKSRAAVGHWETGKNPIDIAKLRRVARLYETTIIVLIGSELSNEDFIALTKHHLENVRPTIPPGVIAPSGRRLGGLKTTKIHRAR